jgi:hypothetical protein
MKLKEYIQKLNGSSEFQEFKSKNPNSFPMAGFFVLDLENSQNTHQIDYYLPEEKKVAAFSLDNEKVILKILDAMSNKAPGEVDLSSDMDLDALKGIIQDEMKNRSYSEDIKKIIAILQNLDGKTIWNLNCVLSGMELLRCHVSDSDKSILKMEKISMQDIMKKVTPSQIAELKSQAQKNSGQEKTSDDNIEEKIKKLNALEQAIEKEKEKLEKEKSN